MSWKVLETVMSHLKQYLNNVRSTSFVYITFTSGSSPLLPRSGYIEKPLPLPQILYGRTDARSLARMLTS